jgi:hypothetical protein
MLHGVKRSWVAAQGSATELILIVVLALVTTPHDAMQDETTLVPDVSFSEADFGVSACRWP